MNAPFSDDMTERNRCHRRLRSLASNSLVALACCVVLIPSGGCGANAPPRKSGTVSGKIDLDGKPLSDVSVTFENPVLGIGASTTVKDGTYSFESPLIVGNYSVTVVSLPAPPMAPKSDAKVAIPQKYTESAKSGLSANVVEGVNKFDFPLKP